MGPFIPPLPLLSWEAAFLSLANIYMEYYKEQLTTCVFSSTVEPSNITYMFNGTVELNRADVFNPTARMDL